MSPPPLSHPPSRHHSRRPTTTTTSSPTSSSSAPPSHETPYSADTSWLTRTASALAAHAMEEEGRSWLARRESATSPSSPDFSPHSGGGGGPDMGHTVGRDERTTSPRGASRFTSRVPSRVGSRAGSRVDLRMTSQLRLSTADVGSERKNNNNKELGAEAITGPDFVDLDERDEQEREEEEGEEGAAAVDEVEMRRLVMGKVGGWVDWMVGWMDLRAHNDEEEEEEEQQEGAKEVGERWRKRVTQSQGGKVEAKLGLPAPGVGGLWEDTRWLMSVAVKSV